MTTAVLLEIQVKPESIEDMKAYLKEILPDTRAYKGCQSIDIYDNLDNTGNFVFYEVWDSRQHYEKYLAWRTETGVVDKLVGMSMGEVSIRYFDRVDA